MEWLCVKTPVRMGMGQGGSLRVVLLWNLWEAKEARDHIRPTEQGKRAELHRAGNKKCCDWQSKLWGWSWSLC